VCNITVMTIIARDTTVCTHVSVCHCWNRHRRQHLHIWISV